jgi:hypothetical protein
MGAGNEIIDIVKKSSLSPQIVRHFPVFLYFLRPGDRKWGSAYDDD